MNIKFKNKSAQLARAVEYVDCISAEGCVLDMALKRSDGEATVLELWGT